MEYALFCGMTCVGVVEAKRKAQDVPRVLQQAKRYAEDIFAGWRLIRIGLRHPCSG